MTVSDHFSLNMPALFIYTAGMKTTQYTIRKIPEQVDRLVRLHVKKTHQSLNTVLLAILKRGIGAADEPVEYHDLDELAGPGWPTLISMPPWRLSSPLTRISGNENPGGQRSLPGLL